MLFCLLYICFQFCYTLFIQEECMIFLFLMFLKISLFNQIIRIFDPIRVIKQILEALGTVMKLYQISEHLALWHIVQVIPRQLQELQIPQAQPALWQYRVKTPSLVILSSSDICHADLLLLMLWNSGYSTRFFKWLEESQNACRELVYFLSNMFPFCCNYRVRCWG